MESRSQTNAKRLVWELAYAKVVLLQEFCSSAISCYTYIHVLCVDCVKRERIHEAYMHQWVVDNMPDTWCSSIMESDKPFWIHAAHSSRTTSVLASYQTNHFALVWERAYVAPRDFRRAGRAKSAKRVASGVRLGTRLEWTHFGIRSQTFIVWNAVAIGPAGSLWSGVVPQETNSYPALTLTLDLANVTLPNRRRPDWVRAPCRTNSHFDKVSHLGASPGSDSVVSACMPSA